MVGSWIINKCIEENQLPVDFPADDIESNMNPSGFVYNESESSQNWNVESPKGKLTAFNWLHYFNKLLLYFSLFVVRFYQNKHK